MSDHSESAKLASIACCPICAKRQTEHLCRSQGYEVRRCAHCCCDFVWPQPSAAELKAYYDAPDYFHGQGPGCYGNYDLDTEAVLPLFREILGEFRGHDRRSILDIGCAYGTHLAIAAEQGWEAYGVEISDHAREEARKRHGDRIAVFPTVDAVPRREFDFITMFDVIEHMPDPYEVFQSLFRQGHIGPGTIVAMTTPNARSANAVSDPAGWPYRHPPAHLVYYSAAALERLAWRIGAREVDVRGIYSEPEHGEASFPDEHSQANAKLMPYAGLLCVASGFSAAPALMYRDELQTYRDELQTLQAQLEEGESDLRKAREEVHRLARNLEEETRKLHVATAEMKALQQTRWFRLRAALLVRPRTLATLAQATRLALAMALPERVRSGLRRLPSKADTGAEPVAGPQVEPYRVRSVSAVVEGRPRVLHVIANFMTGGSSRLVVDLLEHLGDRYEQSVLTSFNPNPPAYVGLEISELRYPESERPFTEHYQKARPAMIHMHYWGDVDEPWYAKAVRAAEQLDIPVIQNVNTPVMPYWSPAVRRYVYVSDYVRHVFGKLEAGHLTIHPGSDFSHFSRRPGEAGEDDCVGMVYRLERDKLNEEAILPFIALVRCRPQTRVLIVGGGGLLPVFQAAVRAAGVADNFEFTGYVSYSELPDLYRRMSVFAAPVWKESFGQVSAFAMNMGVPVCGYDVGAIGEIVGDASLVAPAGDAEALATIMARLLDSPAERASQAARLQQRAQDLYSVEAMVAAYAKTYRELLGPAA